VSLLLELNILYNTFLEYFIIRFVAFKDNAKELASQIGNFSIFSTEMFEIRYRIT